MRLHDSFDVRREDGTPRVLSVFADGVVDHPPVPVVAADRTFNSPNLAVSLAILVGGLAPIDKIIDCGAGTSRSWSVTSALDARSAGAGRCHPG